MYEKLLQSLNQFVPLNSQQQEDISRAVQMEELPKNYLLQEQGKVCNHIYFVLEGIVRCCRHADGKEVTFWLVFEGAFFCSYFSFIYRKPSEDSLTLISNCKLLSISYETLQHLYQKDSVWVNLNRRIIDHYYTEMQSRLMSLLSQSSAERYDNLLQQHPDIERKVKLGHLASYLGIRQETLSRLRATKEKRRRVQDKMN